MNDDAAIDRVARDMTEGELPGDFRARVIARLPQRRRGSWLRIAIPAGAIAALGVAWILSGSSGSSGPSGPSGPSGSSGSVAMADASLGPGTPAGPAGPVEPAVHEPAPPVAPAEPVAPGPAGLDPLSKPAPIVIAPIQPIRPSIAPITVDPLGWDPIPLAPLESRTGGRD